MQEVISRIKNGDKNAFEMIINQYKKYVYTIIYNITHDTQEIDNIAQDTFLKVYLSLEHYSEDNLKAWIGKIAVNKAIDYNRKKKRENEILVDISEYVHVQSKENIENDIIKNENKIMLERYIKNLPDVYAGVLMDYYFHELKYKEIALKENISVKTVESRLYRAKKMLSDSMINDEKVPVQYQYNEGGN